MIVHILRIAMMCAAIVAMLALVVFMFERAGERMGFFFSKKTKITVIAAGLAIAAAFNAELLFDRGLAHPLEAFNFAFFVGFSSFCYGMFDQKNI